MTLAGSAILALLPAAQLASLRPSLEPFVLRQGDVLIAADKPIEHVVFLDAGMVSLVLGLGEPDQIEVGMIGREGMSGLAVALGGQSESFSTVVTIPGRAHRMRADAFRAACLKVPTLRDLALRCGQALMGQMAETSRAGARLPLDARVARWLVLAGDRMDTDELVLTHQALASALGVRRPGVTVALHVLEGEKLIKSTRGRIVFRDRAGLERVAMGHAGTRLDDPTRPYTNGADKDARSAA